MLLSIIHTTELHYSARISETVMEVRMTPRSDAHQTLRGARIGVGPSAPLLEYDDWLGNRVHQFSIVPFHDQVVIVAECAVETHRHDLALDSVATPDPAATEPHRFLDFRRFSGPIVDDARLLALARSLGVDRSLSAGEVALRITHGLRDHITYRKGVTTSTTSVAQVLDTGAGVCQDLAHVAIALLRHTGIAARYVSGYLHKPSDEELETHAWCELYLPRDGWVPIDPTHRKQADDQHVVIAVGRDFSDVPPNRGVFRGDAKESIAARVTIEEVRELPSGLLAPRSPRIDIPSYAEGPRGHREQLDYQQEQQQQ